MSYLTLPAINMADFRKGTISLWFRFSSDSRDNAKEYKSPRLFPGANPEPSGILDGTIPLVTFGKAMGNVYMPEVVSWPHPGGGTEVLDVHSVLTTTTPCAPSHIGILCNRESPTYPTLVMQFQMNTRAAVQGLLYQIKNVFWTEPGGPGQYQQNTELEDISYVRCAEPESFRIEPDFEIEIDAWHHLLVSFDFSESIEVVAAEVGDDYSGDYEATRQLTIKSWGKIWYAFDDENMKGKDKVGRWSGLPIPGGADPGPTVGYVPQDQNGIVPQNAENAVFVYTPSPPDPYVIGGNEVPKYNWAASPIPMNNNQVGLPASENYVDAICHCEMAEFQMFGGIAMDTANEMNRRAFIDFERDEEGRKISDILKPVDPKKTEEFLRRRPDILLHGASKWQKGYNTGATGVEESSTGELVKIPSGQFTPTARINKYKPDPALDNTTA